MRLELFLSCQSCRREHQNYRTSRCKKPQGEKLEIKKYCKFCRTTQIHREKVISKSKKK